MLIVDEEFEEFSAYGNCTHKDCDIKPTGNYYEPYFSWKNGVFEVDYKRFICRHPLSVDKSCLEDKCPRLSGL